MGLSTSFTKIIDPLDIGGTQAAERTLESAQANAELLRKFSDITQANLQPFLDVAGRALPGLEAGATPGGFFGDIEALRPLAESIAAPIAKQATDKFNALLGSQGLTRSGAAVSGAAEIQQQADLDALFQLQSLLTGRQQKVVGAGAGTGTRLAGIGQQSAEQLASIQSQGILGSAQARAAGQQNLIGLAAAGANFLA